MKKKSLQKSILQPSPKEIRWSLSSNEIYVNNRSNKEDSSVSINDIENETVNEPHDIYPEDEIYEFCPVCEAHLIFQKGFSKDLPYWICKGCGEMLINPTLDTGLDIIWRCDQCNSLLNIQSSFNEECGEWSCQECGFVNKISANEIYESEEEYLAEKKNPYKGLSDEEVLSLSLYQDISNFSGRNDIILVKNLDSGKYYIKKLLTTYDKSVYEYLKENPISQMPQIVELFESNNCLIIIEEYIEGETVADKLNREVFSEETAKTIAKDVCKILNDIHSLPRALVHRDVKPSNIIVSPDNKVYLLDMNVAKWYDPDKNDDTHYMGTQYYAAPEQLGFGFSASSAKSDIYAVGMLLNVMLTGKFPKEKKADGPIWEIINTCINLDADKRYTVKELIKALDTIGR